MTIVQQVLVHIVGQNPDVRVRRQDVCQRFQLGLGVGSPGRIRRRIEQEPLGLGRNGFGQNVRLELVAVLEPRLGEYRLAAPVLHDLGVGYPARRRDHNLVAGVDRAHQRIEQHLLAAGPDGYLRGAIFQTVLACELLDDCSLELGDAIDVGVACLALAHGPDGRFHDIRRRIEIRLALAQGDDVAAGRFQLTRFRRHGNGRGRLDAAETVGKKAHGG